MEKSLIPVVSHHSTFNNIAHDCSMQYIRTTHEGHVTSHTISVLSLGAFLLSLTKSKWLTTSSMSAWWVSVESEKGVQRIYISLLCCLDTHTHTTACPVCSSPWTESHWISLRLHCMMSVCVEKVLWQGCTVTYCINHHHHHYGVRINHQF